MKRSFVVIERDKFETTTLLVFVIRNFNEIFVEEATVPAPEEVADARSADSFSNLWIRS
jgi:hypothetical protein